MHTLAALRRLPAARRQALLTAFCAVAAIRIGLSTLGFARLRRLLSPLLTVRTAPVPGAPDRVRWAVARVARQVPGATCLTQALATQVLLAWAGYSSSLRMGARRCDDVFEAHAWLEDGVRVVSGTQGAFAALPPVEALLRATPLRRPRPRIDKTMAGRRLPRRYESTRR